MSVVRRILDAIRSPIGAISCASGLVTALGVWGILSAPIAGVLQGLLSAALGVAMAYGATAATRALQRRAAARTASRKG